jgi:hypothetical protein
MATARVTRALDVPADALWKLVAAFGDTSWMPAARAPPGGAGSELDWSATFEPVGASEADARKAIEGMYGVMVGWIEGRVKASGG